MRKFLSIFLGACLLFSPVAEASVLFDVTDDVLTCSATDDILKEDGAQTWFFRVTPHGDGENNNGYIVSRSQQGTNDRCRFATSGATEALQYSCSGSTSLVLTTNNSVFTQGVEQTWIVTGDGSATAANYHIYVNGVEATYATSQNGSTVFDNSTQTLRIGNADTGARSSNMTIHEAAGWSSVLTAQELAQLDGSKAVQRLPLQISRSNLKRYYALDECADGAACATASMFKDLTGAANACSPSNNPTGAGSRGTYP